MNKEIKKIELTNTTEGHSKWWTGTLFDDNSVVTEWGKIGSVNGSKEFPFATTEEANVFLVKKSGEKIRKGYLPVS